MIHHKTITNRDNKDDNSPSNNSSQRGSDNPSGGGVSDDRNP